MSEKACTAYLVDMIRICGGTRSKYWIDWSQFNDDNNVTGNLTKYNKKTQTYCLSSKAADTSLIKKCKIAKITITLY